MRHNNNPKNKQRLMDFYNRQQELSRKTEDDAKKMKVLSNIDKWEMNLPNSLKGAKPANLSSSLIKKIKETQLKPPYTKQTIITSGSSNVSTYVAYSILYALIQAGIATPSEIKKTSLLDGYNNINGMFGSRRWKDDFFDKKAKILLIEGGSKSLTFLGSKGEDQFWKELADFTRNEDRLVIITYTSDSEEKKKSLFIPLLTNDNELNTSLVKKSVFVPITNEEEKEIETKQRETY